jgi:hypothetical protein
VCADEGKLRSGSSDETIKIGQERAGQGALWLMDVAWVLS